MFTAWWLEHTIQLNDVITYEIQKDTIQRKQEYGMDTNEIQDAVNERGTQTITDEQYSDCRKKVAKHAPRETFIQLSNVLV